MQVTVGADPELFVFDTDSKQYKSAHDLFPGTKQLPEPVDGGAIQVDGVAFEFNINPAATFAQFSNNIRSVLNVGRSILYQQEPKFNLVPSATATFEPGYFEALPSYAKELGCDPDFNAYTGKPNPRPATTEPFRTGSGHVHIGWGSALDTNDPEHIRLCEKMTVQMDCALYFTSLLWDKDVKRRSLYGKLGAYRPKSYGVEYRVLSNRWLNDYGLQRYVFESTVHGAKLLLENDVFLPNDKPIKKMVDLALQGHEFSRLALIDYYDTALLDFGFPALPESVNLSKNLH